MEAFVKVDHQYLEAVLAAAGIGPVFRGWITTTYSDICSVVNVNDYLPGSFSIGPSRMPTLTSSVCTGYRAIAAEVECFEGHPA